MTAAEPTVIADFGRIQSILAHPQCAQALYEEGAQVMADALITLHGDAHSARRIMEFGVFTRGFFRHYEQQVFPATLAPVLQRHRATGATDLVSFGYEVTMNLTADFAGIDRPQDDAAETAELLHLVKTFSEGATLVHSTRDREEVRTRVDAALETFSTQFLAPSRARRLKLVEAVEAGTLDAKDLPRDVMTTLLRNRHTQPLTDDVFRREIAFYLQAGAHSTANATIRALHELFDWRTRHPQEWAQRAGDPAFVQRCVHEALRLFPASPVAWRRALERIEEPDLKAQAGELFVLDLMAANRDPERFGADADRFNPLRDRAPAQPPFGLSFGYGVHACLGRDLDAGVVIKPDTDPARRQLGIVTLMVCALLEAGASPDAAEPPVVDESTVRSTWSRYPIVFQEEAS